MTDRERLLRRVCLTPGDDTPRLIFADWCDEHGEQEHAEFIRVQIEKVQVYRDRPKGIFSPYVDTHSWKTRFEELQQRERELLDAYAFDWFGEFVRGAGLAAADADMSLDRRSWQLSLLNRQDFGVCEFRRGFIDRATCTAELWLTHGPAIVQRQPITRVVLSDKRCVMGSYGSSEWAWFDSVEGESGDSDVIPPPLWEFLAGGVNFYVHPEDGVKLYYSEADANDALSAAALLWARTEAGLEVTA